MHAVYALFPDQDHADEAIERVLTRSHLATDVYGVRCHAHDQHRPRSLAETNAGPGVRRGIVAGVVGGAIFGAAPGPLDPAHRAPDRAARAHAR